MTRSSFGITAGSILLAPLVALVFFSSVCGDDAHITWFSAHSLANFGDFLNYDGQRVEQSSSLLHVLLIAGVHKITGISIPLAANLLSLGFLGGCVGLTRWVARKWGGNTWSANLATLLGATAYPLVYWSVSGLDTTLAAFTFTLAIVFGWEFVAGRRGIFPFALAGLAYCLARPEGFFLLGAILIGIFLLEKGWKDEKGKRLGLALGMVVAMGVLLMIFRHFYFHRLFPEPTYIKAAGITWYKFKKGIKYLLWNHAAPSQWILLGILGMGGIFWSRRVEPLDGRAPSPWVRAFPWVFAPIGALWAFILATGGDWMENSRYLAVLFPAWLGWSAIWLETQNRKWVYAGVVIALQVVNLVGIMRINSRGRPLWSGPPAELSPEQRKGFSFFTYMSKDGARDIPAALALEEVFQRVEGYSTQGPTVMSGQAGLIISNLAYKTGRAFHWQDLWGLTDRTFSQCPPSRKIQLIPIPSWDYQAFFEILGTMERECPAFEKPDIIFEIDDIRGYKAMAENGYRIIFHQRGEVNSGDRLFPGMVFNGGEVIALREDWAESAGFPPVP